MSEGFDDLKKAIEFFGEKQRAYRLTFNREDAADNAVLADLADFCRANDTCVVPGDRDFTYVLEGRRQVYLRIQNHLRLTTEALAQKYTRPAKGAHGHDPSDTSEPA